MHYELWTIAQAWAKEDLRSAEAIFDDLLAAFWHGEFERDGEPDR